MKLINWLRTNDQVIDWKIFSDPWDAMQLRHNPFRNRQIDAIIHSARIEDVQSPNVLDLGCGPGVLGKHIFSRSQNATYYGLDSDPLMLAAMQRLLPDNGVVPLLFDLRKLLWATQYKGKFDAVVSLTALHWLTEKHLKTLYGLVWIVLKPGGSFVVGDPYLPKDEAEGKILQQYQEEHVLREDGMSWNEYWQRFYDKYPIKDLREEYLQENNNEELFEGSDNGYPLDFYVAELRNVGFRKVEVYWKEGLRAVYGGIK